MSIQKAQLQKIAANVIPFYQERQILSNWLSSSSPSTQGRGQLTLRVSAHEVRPTHVVDANPSTTSATIGMENDNDTTSIVKVATNIIRIGYPHTPFQDTRPRLIPYSTVSTINYQYDRLLKDHSIMMEYLERETTTIQSFPPSPQLRTIQPSRKRDRENNNKLHYGQKK